MRILTLLALLATPAMALDEPRTPLKDPFNSGMWSYHQIELLGDPEHIRFDDRVVVTAPDHAEDSFHVPVLVDASQIPDVKRILLTVDYGPIPRILTYWPENAEAKISFRFKIDQSTPVRAAVETHSGHWFVGGTEIGAAGGGCTAPAAAYADADWEDHLGEVHGRIWPDRGRLRMIVSHPMDTGLADGIPIFIIQNLSVSSPEGDLLGRVEMFEPVNEDPALTLYFDDTTLGDHVLVAGRDNNGNEIEAVLQSYATQ